MYTKPSNLITTIAALAILVTMVTLPTATFAQSTGQDDEALAGQLDQRLSDLFKPDAPGAAVLVVRGGEVILRKGYGLANLELGVPIQPEMVFRLGSVTKQFTAMAILMLSEEGKLALTDDITKYLPDYPTHGQTITIEHLLTHTGGIKEYSSVPTWPALSHTDVTPQELVAVFQNEPLDFAPGERWAYSNSGYILLGAIIEKVSGLSYAEFIQQRIFTPLGMTHSYYDDSTHLIPGRVAGYTPTADGYVNAEDLSMTHAYAAIAHLLHHRQNYHLIQRQFTPCGPGGSKRLGRKVSASGGD
jgi:CubicO group peptidase (beta-lactamase class C family)